MRSAHRWSRVVLALGGLVLAGAGPLTAQKSDTLLLRNGDRIVGEISSLEDGLLEYKTDNVGTIKVKWDRVVRLTSRHYYEVETRSGGRYFGTLTPTDSAGYLAVALDEITYVSLPGVVAITRIKQKSIWDRIDGYLDLGFTYAKSNQTLQLTSALEAYYLTRLWDLRLKGDLFIQRQNEADPTRRWSLQPSLARSLGTRWLVYTLAQLQQNQELDLDLRTLISPGGGVWITRSNRREASAFLGLAAQRERYRDTTATDGTATSTSVEVSTGASFRGFRYDFPELDVTANLQIFPSLSDLGRVREEGDVRVRYEVLRDFFITVSLQNSFDSRPPTPDTPKSDFTTTVSISWKF
jgi:hypothetical protein